jgi:hypothetical protein
MANSQVHVGNITSAVLCCTRIRFLHSSINDKTSMPSLSFLRECVHILTCQGTLCHDGSSFGDQNARTSPCHPNFLEGILPHLDERISVDMKERQYLARQYKQYTTYVVPGVKKRNLNKTFVDHVRGRCTSFLTTQLPPSFATEVVKRQTLCVDAVERDPSFG